MIKSVTSLSKEKIIKPFDQRSFEKSTKSRDVTPVRVSAKNNIPVRSTKSSNRRASVAPAAPKIVQHLTTLSEIQTVMSLISEPASKNPL